MSWFVLIFISVNLFAIGSLFDKFFCSKKFKNTFSFAVANYIVFIPLILGLSFFTNFSFSIGWSFYLALISGPVYFLMWLLLWKSLESGEVSRSAAIFNIAPVFNALLACIFLREILTVYKWIAILLIATGAVICSWEKKSGWRFNPVYLLAGFAAIAGATGNVISKFVLREITPLTVYALSFYASLPLYLLLLTKKEVFKEVKTSLKQKKLLAILFIRDSIAFAAICLLYFSLSLGPVSLVASVNGICPLLVFIYSTVISLLWPNIIKEKISRQVLLSKTAAIILIVTGLILINT